MTVRTSMHKWGIGLLLAASALLGASQAQAYTVNLSPVTQTVDLGTVVAIGVSVSDLGPTGLGSYNFDIGFDGAILGFDRVVDAFGLGDSVGLDFVGGAGTFSVSSFSLEDPFALLTRQGADVTLFTLYFNTIGIGTSALTLNSGNLFDVNGVEIVPFQISNASVTVLDVVGQPVSSPGTLALLLTAAAAAALVRRRSATAS